ncbi:MAG: putative toxin-antitoxin system toxin component, PIN family [Kiritimatiellia bacterium]|jgi:putative PIN family toxin of toxin-antitoxin system
MKLRLVLDSNVVISGFLFGGPPARLLEHALAGSIRCFTSLPILDEIRGVLLRPKFGLSPKQAMRFVEELHDLCELATPTERVKAIAEDPDDDAILECALAAKADLIVSGDSHLLSLLKFRRIRILAPAEALAEVEGRGQRG